MNIAQLLSTAKLDGTFLCVGYGRGEDATELSTIKTDIVSIFYDDFSNYSIGKAKDFSLDNQSNVNNIVGGPYNKINYKVNLNKVSVIKYKCPVSSFSEILEITFPYLRKDTIIYIPDYNKNGVYTSIANKYFDLHKLFVTQRNSSYIIKVPPFQKIYEGGIGKT